MPTPTDSNVASFDRTKDDTVIVETFDFDMTELGPYNSRKRDARDQEREGQTFPHIVKKARCVKRTREHPLLEVE